MINWSYITKMPPPMMAYNSTNMKEKQKSEKREGMDKIVED